MLKETAYELEVEIIKDYTNVQKDLQDVLDLMDKGENYKDTVQKVNYFWRYSRNEIIFQHFSPTVH